MTESVATVRAHADRMLLVRSIWQRVPRLVVFGAIAFALAYILFITKTPPEIGGGTWRTTTSGSAVHDPGSFLRIVLDSLTFAGALFIVASGFALIFGLMRVVNMAHGSFYLLGGYIAYEVQQSMTGQGFSIPTSEVNTWEWIVPLLVAAPCIAVVGLPAAGERLDLDPIEFVRREKELTGSMYGSEDPRVSLPVLLEHVRSGALQLAPMVGPRFSLDDVDAAVQAALAGPSGRVIVTP